MSKLTLEQAKAAAALGPATIEGKENEHERV